MSKSRLVAKSPCILLVSLLVLVEICWAEIPTIVVPFEWKAGHIVVQGSIGELDNLNFVIDTGSSFTTINRCLARKLGLRGNRKEVHSYGDKVEIEKVKLNKVEMGRLRLEGVPAWTLDRLSLQDVRKMLRIDALIGLDFLKKTNLTIDYEAQALRFGHIETGPSLQTFYPSLPFLVLRMSVEGQPIRVMLDTGAQDLILFKRRVESRVHMTKTEEVKGVAHCGGKALLRKVRLSDVHMGDTGWSELDAFLMEGQISDTGLDGVLGIHSLGLKLLSLDFQTNQISWDR